MNGDDLFSFFASQSPIFLISFMGLTVAALALAFAIYLTHFYMKRKE